jgi:hypothetical protein
MLLSDIAVMQYKTIFQYKNRSYEIFEFSLYVTFDPAFGLSG